MHTADALQRTAHHRSDAIAMCSGCAGGNGPRTRLSPICAGDALAAAFTWALSKDKTFTEAVHWGVAAGTAAACLPGIQFPTFAQTEDIYKRVELRGNV